MEFRGNSLELLIQLYVESMKSHVFIEVKVVFVTKLRKKKIHEDFHKNDFCSARYTDLVSIYGLHPIPFSCYGIVSLIHFFST